MAGLPTTAACPAFSYRPKADATAVARLRAAGAIVIGKTNLDQFATGLVGVRSPYGVPRNPFNPALIPGGSSSGSAVAVSAGLVPLALGTDTAGSGRVPAGLNNIVGLKPSLGLVSTTGVVPACRSLDCVSIFALTADDAYRALSVMAGPDETDPYSRAIRLGALSELPPTLTIGVPRGDGLKFFGDKRSEAAFQSAMTLLQGMGISIVEIDVSAFLQTARLLYEGPWAAERWAAVGDFIAQHPDDIHPVTREIISSGRDPSAADAFKAFYQLAAYRKTALQALAGIDALMVPTMPAAYTVAELAADPVQLNSNLGTYTNCVNLLDLCGFAVPATFASDGTPFGVTFVAPSGQDAFLASLGRAVHAKTGLPLGALECEACAACENSSDCRRGRDRDRRRRRASLRHAAERRIARARRAFSGKDRNRAGLQIIRAGRHAPAQSPACCASRRAKARRSKSKSGRCRPRASAASSQEYPARPRHRHVDA